MFCRQCGQKLEDDAKFCRFCGNKVEVSVKEEPVKKQEAKTVVSGVVERSTIEKKPNTKFEEKTAPEKSRGNGVLIGIIIVAAVIIAILLFIVIVQNKEPVADTVDNTVSSMSDIETTRETENEENYVDAPVEDAPVADAPIGQVTVNSDAATVLLDADDIYVEYRGIQEWSDTHWVVNLYIENNRNTGIDFVLDQFRINDYVMDVGNNGNIVPSGSKYLTGPEFNLVISIEGLTQYGITSVEELDFDFCVNEEETGEVISETEVHIDVSKDILYSASDVKAISKGECLLDANDIYVGFCGIVDKTDTHCVVDLYIENNSDSTAYIALENTRINDYVIDIGNCHIEIPAGSKYLTVSNFNVVISFDTLAKYGIESITELDFDLKIEEEMFGDAIYEKPIHLVINEKNQDEASAETEPSETKSSGGKNVSGSGRLP